VRQGGRELFGCGWRERVQREGGFYGDGCGILGEENKEGGDLNRRGGDKECGG